MVVTSAAHHSARSTVAASKAVVKFSRRLAGKTCSLGHRTSVAVYQGLEQASSGVLSCMLRDQSMQVVAQDGLLWKHTR